MNVSEGFLLDFKLFKEEDRREYFEIICSSVAIHCGIIVLFNITYMNRNPRKHLEEQQPKIQEGIFSNIYAFVSLSFPAA